MLREFGENRRLPERSDLNSNDRNTTAKKFCGIHLDFLRISANLILQDQTGRKMFSSIFGCASCRLGNPKIRRLQRLWCYQRNCNYRCLPVDIAVLLRGRTSS